MFTLSVLSVEQPNMSLIRYGSMESGTCITGFSDVDASVELGISQVSLFVKVSLLLIAVVVGLVTY